MKTYDEDDISDITGKHMDESDCQSGSVIVKDSNNPPGVIGVVICNECKKEIGRTILGG